MFGKVGCDWGLSPSSGGTYQRSAVTEIDSRRLGRPMHQMRLLALAATSCLLLVPLAARSEDVPKPVEAKRPADAAAPSDPAAKPAEPAKAAAATPPPSNAANGAWNAEVAPSNSSDGIALD